MDPASVFLSLLGRFLNVKVVVDIRQSQLECGRKNEIVIWYTNSPKAFQPFKFTFQLTRKRFYPSCVNICRSECENHICFPFFCFLTTLEAFSCRKIQIFVEKTTIRLYTNKNNTNFLLRKQFTCKNLLFHVFHNSPFCFSSVVLEFLVKLFGCFTLKIKRK